MKKLGKVLKGSVLAVFAVLVFAGGTFAAEFKDCMGNGKKYSNINIQNTKSDQYPVYCTSFTSGAGANAETKKIYGKSSADCQQAATVVSNPDKCESDDLNSVISVIINTIIFVIGMIAVVMIILGGINYATSQGDPNKVKKGKDTILYGIIGLVVALLAFAIVNFVLGALNN